MYTGDRPRRHKHWYRGRGPRCNDNIPSRNNNSFLPGLQVGDAGVSGVHALPGGHHPTTPPVLRHCQVYNVLQGVQEKSCFFTIHCNPSLAYIAVGHLQSPQCNPSVYSHSYWLVFFSQPISAECGRGRLLRIIEKTQYLMNTLY